jgi:hypothetical protein
MSRDLLGAPPLPPAPPDLFDFRVDEGPMRRDLRRQIMWLERDLVALREMISPWEPIRTHEVRGPGLMTGSDLEAIRDELLEQVNKLRARLGAQPQFD